MQMWNLTRVLNKGKFLENLKDINEVYGSQVTLLDEIIYYHKFNYKNGECLSLNTALNGESNAEINDLEEDKNELEDKIFLDNSFNINFSSKKK